MTRFAESIAMTMAQEGKPRDGETRETMVERLREEILSRVRSPEYVDKTAENVNEAAENVNEDLYHTPRQVFVEHEDIEAEDDPPEMVSHSIAQIIPQINSKDLLTNSYRYVILLYQRSPCMYSL